MRASVPVRPVPAVTLPPVATNRAGHVASQPSLLVQALVLVPMGSMSNTYSVRPFGPTRKPLLLTVTVTLLAGEGVGTAGAEAAGGAGVAVGATVVGAVPE